MTPVRLYSLRGVQFLKVCPSALRRYLVHQEQLFPVGGALLLARVGFGD